MNTSNRFDIETVAKQRQSEISKELATRHLLKESGLNVPLMKQTMRIAWRVAPVTFAIIILIWLNFLR
jgi:hypothetical protein